MTAARRFRLYEQSVQDAEACVEFIDAVFAEEHREPPVRLREDFCGTAKLCAAWVKSGPDRRAVGLDIDRPTLAWAARHNLQPLGADARRVELLERDVLDGTRRRFDVITAFNFSYWVFKERRQLRAYFEKARRGLRPGGAFLIDLHGGPDTQFALEERTRIDGFEYFWEQEHFRPLDHSTRCHIHFRLPGGREIRRAFTYEWRVWSLPELRDLLDEVGFGKIDVWWEGEGDEMVRMGPHDENLVSWLANVVAWR